MSANRGNGYDKNVTVAFPGGEMSPALARAQAMSPTPVDPEAPQTSSTGLKIVVNNDGSVDIDVKKPAA